jgi:hypothetical protein
MKNGNKIIFVIANSGLLSLLSFAAIAGPSTPVTLEKMIPTKTEQQLAAERTNTLKLFHLRESSKMS